MTKFKLVPVELTQEMIDERRAHIQLQQDFGAAPDFDRHVIAEVPEFAKIVEALEEMIDVAERVDSWGSFPSDPIVEALEEMIDVAERVDSWESFSSDPIARAEDAIRAYRAQLAIKGVANECN